VCDLKDKERSKNNYREHFRVSGNKIKNQKNKNNLREQNRIILFNYSPNLSHEKPRIF
jgi:hypothetical protein